MYYGGDFMDKELKKDIKKLLFLDTLLSSTGSVSRILDEVEEELEEIFGRPEKNTFRIEDIFKIKNLK
jgi:ERCC4-type nuclease